MDEALRRNGIVTQGRHLQLECRACSASVAERARNRAHPLGRQRDQ